MANIKIPTPLRKFTNGKSTVECDGKNISELITKMEREYPGIRDRLVDDEGKIRKFVNIYTNGQDIRFLENMNTKVGRNDEISIVPAVSGG